MSSMDALLADIIGGSGGGGGGGGSGEGGWRVEGGGIWRCVFLCVVLWVRGEVVRLNNLSGGAYLFVVATPFLLFANTFLAVICNR